MPTDSFFALLSEQLNTKFQKPIPISGGDISDAFLLEDSNGRFFLKVNDEAQAEDMFAKEGRALKLLGSTGEIITPEVIDHGKIENHAFLLLEFIESKRPSADDFSRFGSALALLHRQSANQFGYEEENYIGSLVQVNKGHENWSEFYARERLMAQLKLAQNKGLMQSEEIPALSVLETRLTAFFPEVKPSLLHGDLWSGNFLIAQDGAPVLIDPAVFYGHSLVDMAMTKLFGGFAPEFYQGYLEAGGEEITPAATDIYQLYYLLVHLNLFGRSYYPKVKSLMIKYFQND